MEKEGVEGVGCQSEGCGERRTGGSKYCPAHRREARARWIETIEKGKGDRAERDRVFLQAWREGCQAAQLAYDAAVTQPMAVVDPLRGQQWIVPEGPCGFAEIVVRNGNSAFARWLRKNVPATRKRYHGGVLVSTFHMCRDETQSYQRKMEAADACAEVLRSYGIEAYADGRLD